MTLSPVIGGYVLALPAPFASLLAPWMAAVAAKLRELGIVSAVFAAVLAERAVL